MSRNYHCSCWYCDPTLRRLRYNAELDNIALTETKDEVDEWFCEASKELPRDGDQP